MGVLTPLFLAGLGALSLPLILHLIRRTPRGRQVFSSLMFLSPSPPRITRRSRLDNLLLLLLRAGILALLALAFARPFVREDALLPLADLPRRRVAILLDDSASMRRPDLWQQAVRKVEEVLADLAPQDDVALFTFNDRLRTVVDFEQETGEQAGNKADLVRQSLKSLSPSWGATDLGAAMVAVAHELDVANEIRKSPAEPRMVVVSDWQRGSNTLALQAITWPEQVRVVDHRVSPTKPTNAFAHLLIDEEQAESPEPRVRLANAADSSGDQFTLRWSGERDAAAEEGALATYVPPGQTRVVRLPRPATALSADRIVLRGDENDFDNTHFVVPPRQLNVGLVYVGSDAADDAKGPRYYLQLALADDPLRKVEVTARRADEATPPLDERVTKLAVVVEAISKVLAEELTRYAGQGGTLLLAPKDREASASLIHFFDDVELDEEAVKSDGKYLMLGEIDFSNPLFAPFANPRYSDFTKIHFWRRRPLKLKTPATTRVVARFDNGQPAILERTVGAGRALLFASGWHPEESQLALSSKFVPLMQNILDLASGGRLEVASVTVGQPVPLPAMLPASVTVTRPDGSQVSLPQEAQTFDAADQPGLYRLQVGDDEYRFAVNLASAESNTAPLDLETLEQMGVRFGTEVTRAERLDRERQQRDIELEGRQKVWRWLIVAALAFVILETWLAGRTARKMNLEPAPIP